MKENQNTGSKKKRGMLDGYLFGGEVTETVYIRDSQTVSGLLHGAAARSQGHCGTIKLSRETMTFVTHGLRR